MGTLDHFVQVSVSGFEVEQSYILCADVHGYHTVSTTGQIPIDFCGIAGGPCGRKVQSGLSSVQASASETQMERRYDPKCAARRRKLCVGLHRAVAACPAANLLMIPKA